MHRDGGGTSRRDFFVCLTLSKGETRLGSESMSHELLSSTVTLRQAHDGTALPHHKERSVFAQEQCKSKIYEARVMIEAIDAYRHKCIYAVRKVL